MDGSANDVERRRRGNDVETSAHMNTSRAHPRSCTGQTGARTQGSAASDIQRQRTQSDESGTCPGQVRTCAGDQALSF